MDSSIELLREMIHVLNPDKRSLSIVNAKKDKTDQLYYDIENDKVKSSDEILEAYYKNRNGAIRQVNYLKKRLNDRLINSFFAYDFYQAQNELQKVHIEIHKKFALSKMFEVTNNKKIFIPLAEQCLKLSTKYHYTYISHLVSQTLFIQYSLISDKPAKAEQYRKLLTKYRDLHFVESELEIHFFEALAKLLDKRSADSELIKLTKSKYQIMKELAGGKETMRINYFIFSIGTLLAQLMDDNKRLESLCLEAIDYFNSFPFDPPKGFQFGFNFRIIPIYIVSQEFNTALNYIDKCKSLATEGTYNYFQVCRYEIILNFHRKDFGKALEIKERAQHYFNRMPIRLQEDWMVFDAYFSILNMYGLFEFENQFRVGRFFNDIYMLNKDKKVSNIHLLIIRFMFYLYHNREKNIDYIEAIQQYKRRHLQDKYTERANTLLDFFTMIAQNSFDLINVNIEQAKKDLKKSRVHLAKTDIDPEILTFEMVIEMIVTHLS